MEIRKFHVEARETFVGYYCKEPCLQFVRLLAVTAFPKLKICLGNMRLLAQDFVPAASFVYPSVHAAPVFMRQQVTPCGVWMDCTKQHQMTMLVVVEGMAFQWFL